MNWNLVESKLFWVVKFFEALSSAFDSVTGVGERKNAPLSARTTVCVGCCRTNRLAANLGSSRTRLAAFDDPPSAYGCSAVEIIFGQHHGTSSPPVFPVACNYWLLIIIIMLVCRPVPYLDRRSIRALISLVYRAGSGELVTWIVGYVTCSSDLCPINERPD